MRSGHTIAAMSAGTAMRPVAASLALCLAFSALAAVPPGYRYIGSRTVSAGRVILWYWNPDTSEPGGTPASFAARLFARAIDTDQERPYVALVRCDDRTYRPASESGPFLPIDDGEPIAAVYRAGCVNGAPASVAQRRERLDGVAAMPGVLAAAPSGAASGASMSGASSASANAAPADTSRSAASPPPSSATPLSAAPRESGKTEPAVAATDPRRADACLRFADTRSTPAGDATITNACTYPIEVALCYKGGGGGSHDCGTPVRGRLVDSLPPGVTHVLPEYRRGRHRGIAAMACRGAPGTVLPRLDEPGRSACT